MADDALQQLEKEVQQLQQELHATQARLQQVSQRLQQLQSGNEPPAKAPNIFKPPIQKFSLENFIGLRLIHLVGIVVLVIGLSIGVKYAIDRQLISETLRILLAYGAGLLLYVLSWQLRKKYAPFSAILFSGAMASLYFTSYASFVYYHLFSFAVAFVLMIVLTVATVYQALAYNRQEIAVLGLVGAYGIPFLISSNAGRAELLFAYMAVINAAVIFLAFKRGWKSVALLAQGITWLLLMGWALTRFEPGQQSIAYFFSGLFFVLFSAHALLGAAFHGQALQRWQAQQVLINNLVFYFAAVIVFQRATEHADYGFLHSAFFIFATIQAVAVFLFLRHEDYLKKGLVLLALCYLLLFIGNKWDGITVTLLWLLLAVVLFCAGIGLKAAWLRLFGMVLMGLTLGKLVLLDSQRFSTVQKIIAYLTLGILLLAVGFFYQRFKDKLFGTDQ